MKRRFVSLFSVLALLASFTSAFAIDPHDSKDEFTSPVPISERGAVNPNCAINSIINNSVISGQKTQTKNAYFGNHEYVGAVTLYYKTQVLEGRPQFVYEECYIGVNWGNPNEAITNAQVTSYSGDYIVFQITGQLGPITETAVVTFTPA